MNMIKENKATKAVTCWSHSVVPYIATRRSNYSPSPVGCLMHSSKRITCPIGTSSIGTGLYSLHTCSNSTHCLFFIVESWHHNDQDKMQDGTNHLHVALGEGIWVHLIPIHCSGHDGLTDDMTTNSVFLYSIMSLWGKLGFFLSGAIGIRAECV